MECWEEHKFWKVAGNLKRKGHELHFCLLPLPLLTEERAPDRAERARAGSRMHRGYTQLPQFSNPSGGDDVLKGS